MKKIVYLVFNKVLALPIFIIKIIFFINTFAIASELNIPNKFKTPELPSKDEVELKQDYGNFDNQPKVTDLALKNSKSQATFPEKSVQNEVIPNLPEVISNNPHEISVSELGNKLTFPKTQTPQNLPLVAELDEKPLIQNSQETLPTDPNYKIPPRIAPNERINPFTTTLPLNGIPISHLTKWELFGGSGFGDDRNVTFDVNGIFKLNSRIQENLTRNNIYTVDQKGTYLQLQTVRQSRKVTVLKKEPQTLFGTQIQMSLTASCLFPGTSSDKQCTYTPGLVTDKNSIDPNFFVPTRIVQTANVGDVVTPESLAVMSLPGFQMGANGQKFGVDFYFPNAGTLPGNTQGNTPFYTRKENIDNTPATFYSTVRQVVRANDKKAVIGRTIRGYGFILNDDNTLLNSALQLGNFILPDANPQLQGGANPVNPNINKNLFLAANNTRLPVNSFTFYHAGIGQAKSPAANITSLNQVPSGNFNSIWFGISPVILRRIDSVVRYEPTGPRRMLAEAGAEGGVNSNVAVASIVNGEVYSPATLQNFYTQIYLEDFVQDVNFANGSRLTEKTVYYPHISFSGNITGSSDVFRYYAGVITGDTIKAYLGGDFSHRTSSGWTYSAGGIGYVNPDRDYYSQLVGSITKKIPLSKTNNLVFSTGLNYAIDQDTRIGRTISISPASSLTLGARANIGPVSFGLVNYFGDILPNSIENTLLADFEIRFSENFRLSAYYTPINESISRSRYGARAQWKMGKQYNSPTLSLSWSNNDYDYGRDLVGNNFNVTENVFTVLFKLGDPPNPFDQQTAERLRRGIDQGVEQLEIQRNRQDVEEQKPQPIPPR
ncbi:hypothetical protein [Nostoc sp. ChiVER01]|uniref:hypothetical protein n=1 Tax=Nostoc sp. ChiVER01 TaxID=3075382 RepID=UPI002AD33593|nr:hypothetical protein [Nostoc sp. ChiVER01]MDZ8223579.1 hypothetical protein [Nostoc sp. ChiVER01]